MYFQQPLYINGNLIYPDEIADFARGFIANENEDWKKDLVLFLQNWYSSSSHIKVSTSGTTGTPKTILLSKKSMFESAQRTLSYFKLSPGNNIALVLPCKYIAGKMVVVRAIAGSLNLLTYTPSTTFGTKITSALNFIAIAPNQVNTTTRINLLLRKNLKVLVGGAPLPSHLESALIHHNINAYQSYASTETASHVAIRPVKPGVHYYEAMDGVHFSQNKHGCLVIHSNYLDQNLIHTNDVIELFNHTRFRWIGRADNIINSGGIKINPEEIERKITSLISNRFYICGKPDNELGEIVVLVIEGEINKKLTSCLWNKLNVMLPKYHIPKEILFREKFEETANGKIKRSL